MFNFTRWPRLQCRTGLGTEWPLWAGYRTMCGSGADCRICQITFVRKCGSRRCGVSILMRCL